MTTKAVLGMALALAMALAVTAEVDTSKCKKSTLDFIYLDGDAKVAAIVDDIAKDLAKVGVTATPKKMVKADLNAAMQAGKFNMVLSETWANPYDPHSYLSSWNSPNEAHHMVLKDLKAPLDPVSFKSRTDAILSEASPVERQKKYKSLLTDIHQAAIHIPLYGKRIPSVVNKRLMGYTPGLQQFDYPVQNLKAVTGSQTVTVAPGAQTGLFKTVGRLDPHSYRPNEFFASNWVYEGLTTFGAAGVEPSLAKSWTIAVDANKIETISFTLRDNVKFHDGAEWNCSVAKLNFDHVLAPPLTGPDWHGWYSLPTAIESTSCNGETFVVKANKPYYPLLQELTYIRPLRMLSPNAFYNGLATSPITHNSCPAGWGQPTCYTGAPAGCVTITCNGTQGIFGTGPFRFFSRTKKTGSTDDDNVVFKRNADYWGKVPEVDITIKNYDTADAVETALKAGTLDAVIGAGVLKPSVVQTLKYDDTFDVRHTEPIMNVVVILKIPDITMRKVVIHAVNKGAIIEAELGGLETPVSQLFPTTAPYCDLDLTPKFDYDIEKTELLNCVLPAKTNEAAANQTLFIVFAVVAVCAVAFVGYMMKREKSGEPLFTPLVQQAPKVNEMA